MANTIWPGWETVRELGRGGFGSVYEIRKQIFDHVDKAALKVISLPQNRSEINEMLSEGYDEKSISARFQSYLEEMVKEYNLMAELKGNPNIVYCDDLNYVQHSDGIGWDIYIKMELLTPLTDILTETVDESLVLKLAMDMCRALTACKKKNIIHRDIKPQNIFVTKSGDFKLGDFGIAKTAERTTSGTKTGTYKYMAPEVYNNQPYGLSVDIYSLGLVLYWLLNERRMPFLPLPPAVPTATQDDEARRRRMSGEALPFPAHGSNGLRRIILRACAYDPKARYASAEEMLADLQFLSEQGSQAMQGTSGAEHTYTPESTYGGEHTCGTESSYGGQNIYGSQDTYGGQDTYGSQNAYGGQWDGNATMGAGGSGVGREGQYGQQSGGYGDQTMGNSWTMNEDSTDGIGARNDECGSDQAAGKYSDGNKTQGVFNTDSYKNVNEENFGGIFGQFFGKGGAKEYSNGSVNAIDYAEVAEKLKQKLAQADGVIAMAPEALGEGQERTVRHPYDDSKRFAIQIPPGSRIGQKIRIMDQGKALLFELVMADVVLLVQPTKPLAWKKVTYQMTIGGRRIGVAVDGKNVNKTPSVGHYIGKTGGYSHCKVDVYLNNLDTPGWSVQVPHFDVREGYITYIIMDLPKMGWLIGHAPEIRVEYRKR